MAPNIPVRRSAADSRPASLSEQFKKIFRHPLILLVCILSGAMIGGLAAIIQEPTYKATSKVVVYPLTVDPNAQATNQMTVDIDTEASVAGSREVADSAAAKIDSTNQGLANKINNNVKVIPHSGSAILDFSASASTAEDAAKYANAAAEAYLEVRQASLKAHVDENVQSIENTLANTGEEKSGIRTALEEKLAQVQVTSTSAGRVITAAKAPAGSNNLDAWKFILVGAIAGALIGAVVAAVIDSKSRRVQHLDRASDLTDEHVHGIRPDQAVEDARRMLLSLGLTHTGLENAERTGAVVYSPTPGVANELSELLAHANGADAIYTDTLQELPWAAARQNNKLVFVNAENSEISEALSSAQALGNCIFVMNSETSVEDIKEFVAVAGSAETETTYVYLQK